MTSVSKKLLLTRNKSITYAQKLKLTNLKGFYENYAIVCAKIVSYSMNIF